MEGKRLRVQRISALCAILLFFATLLSYFIIPRILDARTRRALGDENAYVTGSARSPWISVDAEGLVTLYPEYTVGMSVLVIPDAVDGVRVTGGNAMRGWQGVKVLVLPAGYGGTHMEVHALRSWEDLETLILPEGLTDLSKLDPVGCTSLRTMYLPTTIKEMHPYVAMDFPEGAEIYYAGSAEKFATLGKWATLLANRCQIVYNTPVPEY